MLKRLKVFRLHLEVFAEGREGQHKLVDVSLVFLGIRQQD